MQTGPVLRSDLHVAHVETEVCKGVLNMRSVAVNLHMAKIWTAVQSVSGYRNDEPLHSLAVQDDLNAFAKLIEHKLRKVVFPFTPMYCNVCLCRANPLHVSVGLCLRVTDSHAADFPRAPTSLGS